jgi:hypothetical protein
VDRIEVESLRTREEEITGVVATQKLEGEQMQALRHLWRSQSYVYFGEIMCHRPIYRLRFYWKNSLLVEATICFHCHNIYFYKVPGTKATDDLQVNFLDGKNLRAFLDNLFPNPKDRPVSEPLSPILPPPSK